MRAKCGGNHPFDRRAERGQVGRSAARDRPNVQRPAFVDTTLVENPFPRLAVHIRCVATLLCPSKFACRQGHVMKTRLPDSVGGDWRGGGIPLHTVNCQWARAWSDEEIQC